MQRFLLIFFASVFVFSACDKHRVMDENKELPSSAWHYKNALPFDVIIYDTTKFYTAYVNLRVHSNYKYSNIFMWVHQFDPLKHEEKVRVEIKLADDAGRWLGKGLGDVYEYRFPFASKTKFEKMGVYRYELEQNMRDDTLMNVISAGLRVEEFSGN